MFSTTPILLEGALGERLKREYALDISGEIAMAGLVCTAEGRAALAALWREYAAIADRHHLPFLATTPTRRANQERMASVGADASLITENVAFLKETLRGFHVPTLAGVLMGCRGDAYTGAGALCEADAADFHAWQANAALAAGADFLMAGILPTLPEAVGIARAMAATNLPYLISFTILPTGTLIDGTPISDAIAAIDCVTPAPVGYMTNCIHPAHVLSALAAPCNQTQAVRTRFIGVQANTSPLSYAELDGAADLHSSPPDEWAAGMCKLRDRYGIRIFGGCCGTDGSHMAALAAALRK